MAEGAGTSVHAASRANLRETAKWIVTGTAAIVVLLVGGSSFSQLGSLEFGVRFWLAVAAIALGSILCWAPFRSAIEVIATELVAFEAIRTDPSLTALKGRVDQLLQARFPEEINTVDKLEAAYAAQIAIAQNEATRAAAKTRAWDEVLKHNERMTNVTDIFNTMNLRAKFDRLIAVLKRRIGPVLGFFLVFAWAANPGKELQKPLKNPYQLRITRDVSSDGMFAAGKLAPQCFDGTVSFLVIDDKPGGRVGAVAVPTGPAAECKPIRVDVIAPSRFTAVD